MLAAAFAITQLWPDSAMAVSRIGAFVMPLARPAVPSAVGSTRHIRPSQGDGGFGSMQPVADRTVLPAPASHHPTPRHYRPVRHNNKMTQQYYQPARQYYQWHVH
jgi:hypothetical protein